MNDAKDKLTVHVSLEFPDGGISLDELQLVINHMPDLLGRVLRMDETEEE